MHSRLIPCVLGLIAFCSLSLVNAAAHDRHSRNVSIYGDGDRPAETCSDLRIKIDDRPAAMASEEKSFSKSEMPVMRVTGETNGGVQVSGWDKDGYSVTLCKAAEQGSDAERKLAQIKLVTEGGEIRVSGPAHDDDWTAYLLIRVPKAASVDLHVNNGPLSLYSVEGKIVAKAVNGPITAKDCKGEVRLTAQNGPITADGTSGTVELHTENGPITSNETSGSVDIRTQNGPIEVALSGTNWNGTGLQAHAQNGPLTVRVPQGYKSGVVIESDGHSPLACHAAVCSEARKTWDDEKKRIEFGSGPTVVRASTVNGPISVD